LVFYGQFHSGTLEREYRTANKLRDGRVDEDQEEEALTGAGKDLKKLVRKMDKNE